MPRARSTVWLFLAVGLFACGDDSEATDGGTDATTDTSSQKDAATTDSTVSDASVSDSASDGGVTDAADAVDAADAPDALTALDCNTYCTGIVSACTGGNTQFIDKPTCLAVCSAIPKDGGANATSGNSLECRGHYLALAATDAGGNCAQAGAYGFGACGNLCDDFCSLYGSKCDIDAGWGGYASCVSACAQIPGATDKKGPWTDAGPDKDNPDMPCREYHLESAFGEGGAPECDPSAMFPLSGCVQL